jgi:hypothetical protein
MISMMRRCVLAVAMLSLILAVGQAEAGLIILSGDQNMSDALVGNGTPINPGNERFFSNVLGGGTHVVVQGTDLSGIDTPVANINTYYNTIAGVTSTIQSGPVTTASLSGVNLFVSAIPASSFAIGEISALSAFSASGGTIFLLGDTSVLATAQDANLNALLAGLGSNMRIVPGNIDPGFHLATGAQIVSDPLTIGVTSITYAGVSPVTGGNPQGIIKVQTGVWCTTSTPEPSSVVLACIGGVAGIVYAWRHRSRSAA